MAWKAAAEVSVPAAAEVSVPAAAEVGVPAADEVGVPAAVSADFSRKPALARSRLGVPLTAIADAAKSDGPPEAAREVAAAAVATAVADGIEATSADAAGTTLADTG